MSGKKCNRCCTGAKEKSKEKYFYTLCFNVDSLSILILHYDIYCIIRFISLDKIFTYLSIQQKLSEAMCNVINAFAIVYVASKSFR
jgi:hypothetical protein